MESLDMSITYEKFKYYYRFIRNGSSNSVPILVISGAFQNMDSWKKYVQYFSAESTVILLDLPGVGRSDFLPPDKGVDFLVGSIYKLLGELSISKCSLISASYGTPIAYRFAQKYPELLSSVVLGGTMKEIPRDFRSRIIHSLQLLEKKKMEEFASYVVHNGLLCRDENKIVARRKLVERVIYLQLKNMSGDEIERYISNTWRLLKHEPLDLNDKPSVRALVFTGEHDVFTLPQYCREMAAAFKNAVFTTIKHSDHLSHIQQFPVVTELLMRFLKNKSLEGMAGCNAIEYFNA